MKDLYLGIIIGLVIALILMFSAYDLLSDKHEILLNYNEKVIDDYIKCTRG